MIQSRTIPTVLLFSIIATFLFSNESIGLNLFIFEILYLSYLIFRKEVSFKTVNQITCFFGFLLSSVFVVLTNSTYSILVNFIALVVFVGIIIFPESRSLLNSVGLSFYALYRSPIEFINRLSILNFKGRSLGKVFKGFGIYVLPIVIVFFFVSLYRISNPFFNNIVGEGILAINEFFSSLFVNFDLALIFTFIISAIISCFVLIRSANYWILDKDNLSQDVQFRIRWKQKGVFGIVDLKKELRSAIFLFVLLNIVLLVLNCIDIYWVWFNFEWQGQYLKQFVHEGTYLLILSILISIVLVLYYFRNNLNFYPRNNILKVLCYLWLIQNGILAISVGIRNYRYIEYFSLAYKRIGVVIFLILVLYGLYTVLIKVYKRKSSYYLLRKNAYFLFVILLSSSFVNWDKIIVKYNFSHAENSFLHLDYLASLSDQVLPGLGKSLNEMKALDVIQKKKFPFEQQYMTPEKYFDLISKRSEEFKKNWEAKGILSWNLPDHLAYKKLRQ